MAQQLREAREELLDADTIMGKNAANVKLESTWKQVYESLVAHADDVPASVEGYVSTLKGAQSIIEKSDYNKQVSDFRNGTLAAFPVNILKNLALVDYPDYFGAKG
jgi:hypothetical protein